MADRTRTGLREVRQASQVQWRRFTTDPRVPDVLAGMVGGIGLVLVVAAVRGLVAAQWGRTLLALLLGAGCLALVWLHLALSGSGGARRSHPNPDPDPDQQGED